MQCHKCDSPRIIRFLDGFGNRRVFCKGCHESFLIEEIMTAQKKLIEFGQGGGEYGGFSNIAVKLDGR